MHWVLDEMVVGGVVVETSTAELVDAVRSLDPSPLSPPQSLAPTPPARETTAAPLSAARVAA